MRNVCLRVYFVFGICLLLDHVSDYRKGVKYAKKGFVFFGKRKTAAGFILSLGGGRRCVVGHGTYHRLWGQKSTGKQDVYMYESAGKRGSFGMP